jgi:hypothetical protein
MKYVILVHVLLTFGLILDCKKPAEKISEKPEKKETNQNFALVVLSIGESRILHSDLTEEKAVLGASFKSGDKIVTGPKSKVDIQIGGIATIRVASNSSVEFSQIIQNSTGSSDTKLSLGSGKLYAKVNKTQKKDNFSVATPTFIAGIRGTEFIVEFKNDNKGVVKVVDGSVAVSPRVRALEEMPMDQVEKNPGLSKLKSVIQSSEVVVEKGKEYSLPPNDKILGTNSLSEKNAPDVTNRVIALTNNKVATDTDITKSEEQELKTMVSVDLSIAQDMIRLNDELSSGQIDDAKAEELESRRKVLEEQIAEKQEQEKLNFNDTIVHVPKKLQSNKDIVQYYERIEKIILSNGRYEIGAIIHQEGSTMIVHTENGIKRINSDEVQEVIYDYQTKLKF